MRTTALHAVPTMDSLKPEERIRTARDMAGRFVETERYHCAEAVAAAVLAALGHDPEPVVALATPFGAGFGKTYEEACGALSGGLLAIGRLHGRSEPGAPWDRAAGLAAELRRRFVAEFGHSRCGDLRRSFGERQGEGCRRLIARAAAMAAELLLEP